MAGITSAVCGSGGAGSGLVGNGLVATGFSSTGVSTCGRSGNCSGSLVCLSKSSNLNCLHLFFTCYKPPIGTKSFILNTLLGCPDLILL